jgi:Flp pilus assembly protein TadD
MRAVTIDPRSARAWMWLGACESQRGDLVAAREYLDKAVALNPEMRSTAEGYYDIPGDLRGSFFADEPSA